MTISAGEKAPEFTAKVVGYHKDEVSLSELLGEQVVLMFYPKDDTPGWTIQGCSVRDHWGEISEKAKLFGVSCDGVEKHQKFIEKYDLPYPLICDASREIVKAYGVAAGVEIFGKPLMLAKRVTVIIGKDGVVVAVMDKVKPKTHLDELMMRLASLENDGFDVENDSERN